MEALGKRFDFENKYPASGGGLTKTTIFSKTQNVNVNLRTFLRSVSLHLHSGGNLIFWAAGVLDGRYSQSLLLQNMQI